MTLSESRPDLKKAVSDFWQSSNSYVKKKRAKFGKFCRVWADSKNVDVNVRRNQKLLMSGTKLHKMGRFAGDACFSKDRGNWTPQKKPGHGDRPKYPEPVFVLSGNEGTSLKPNQHIVL